MLAYAYAFVEVAVVAAADPVGEARVFLIFLEALEEWCCVQMLCR